jgi:hypothetical protein
MRIEQLKMRPLIHIGYRDSEAKISINMINKGAGPLMITKYYFQNEKDPSDIKPHIFDLLNKNYMYDNYSGNQINTVLSAGATVNLFRLEGNPSEKEYKKVKNSIREEFSKYKIVIEYKDVYDKQMPRYERSLEWFGRNI